MWPYYPDLLTRNVPRYTSYPTAAEFHDDVGSAQLSAALNEVGSEDAISLYVHIPYCREICWYCGCNTGAAGKVQRLASYLGALENEITLIADRLGGRGRVKNIAFGGGSPNAVSPVEFVRVVDRILTNFACDDPNISVELDPRIFTTEWAETLAHCGVSRVSLGVQSFSEDIQRAIGRIQPLKMIQQCMSQLRVVGINAVNFDLMYGLPGQSVDDLNETLDTAIALEPSRITLFGYAHIPQLFPRQRRIDDSQLPDSAKRFEMAYAGYRHLTWAGYQAVGFDHFAQTDDSMAIASTTGKLHRNFQGFTDDSSPVMIGMGASAISNFPNYIIQNEKNPGRYRMLASAESLTASRGVARSAADQLRAKLIENLLCTGHSGPIPLPMFDAMSADLAVFLERQLVTVEEGGIILEASGLPYSRVVASLFDSYRQPNGNKFSLAI